MLLGELDSYTPAAQCERQAARLREAGGQVTVITYPGAYHAWDGWYPLQFTTFDYSYGRCAFEIGDQGEVVDVTTGQAVTTLASVRAAITACGTRGVWIGANLEVARRSLADLKAILRRTLAP
jgi:dienelactone hydrolase